MPIYPNIYQTLLPGPIVELRGYLAACGLRGRLYAYLNYNGPTGTARDELAEGMLALALERGALTPGQTIVEAVSGPFATALTLAGLTAGHPVTLVMPEDAPAMRQESLLRLGAQIIHTPAQAGLAGARALAKATAAEKGWYYMDLLNNDDNPTYHRRVTGPALVRSIAREGSSIVDSIVIGVGSGGTITGVGETVKAWTNDVRIVAVEPASSPLLSQGGAAGPAHRCHPGLPQRRCRPSRSGPAYRKRQKPFGTGRVQRTPEHTIKRKREGIHDKRHDDRSHHAPSGQIHHPAGAGQPVPAHL